MDEIKNILRDLGSNQVDYCILRNYDFLSQGTFPRKHSERSIDLVVSKKTYPAFHNVLVKNGFRRRRTLSFSYAHKPYYKFVSNHIISFDVQVGGVYWNDMRYLQDTVIMNHKILQDFFYILSDDDMFVMLVAHSILGKRRFKKEYQTILQSLQVKEKEVGARLDQIFPRKGAWLVAMVRQGKFSKILNTKYGLIARFLLSKPRRIWTLGVVSCRWVWWKKLGRSAPLIAFIGPDGAGKSSAVSALVSYLETHGRNVSMIYTGRGRNHILPFTKFAKKYKTKERRKDRGSKKKTSLQRKVLYSIASPFYTLDLLLRYYISMFPQRKKHNVVITDRYCTDIYLMEHVPLWFRSLLLRLFPKPTLTFYLYNDVSVLLDRRPEENKEGLERQMRHFTRLQRYLHPHKIKSDDKMVTQNQVKHRTMAYLLDNWW